ncbi:MAG: hypothetical protein WC133_03255 [Candidatus Omnitrophota bacterium]
MVDDLGDIFLSFERVMGVLQKDYGLSAGYRMKDGGWRQTFGFQFFAIRHPLPAIRGKIDLVYFAKFGRDPDLYITDQARKILGWIPSLNIGIDWLGECRGHIVEKACKQKKRRCDNGDASFEWVSPEGSILYSHLPGPTNFYKSLSNRKGNTYLQDVKLTAKWDTLYVFHVINCYILQIFNLKKLNKELHH